MTYQATRESLNAHPVPEWFDDAKLGIFIHWGLFSVPAFAPRLKNVSDAFSQHYSLSAVMTPYTEWYDNALRVPESPSARHHAEHWNNRPYEDFREPFGKGLDLWDPAAWADLFHDAGARYVVLVSKHHDGYCLWPTSVAHSRRDGWASRRDVVGELAAAVRSRGMRFGVYYSGGIDWSFNPTPARTFLEFVGSVPGGPYPAYAEAQVRELIERYQPSLLWNDISWPRDEKSMLQLMVDYYEAVPEGVVNDRWMHRGAMLRALGYRPVQKVLDALVAWRIRREVRKGTYKPGLVPPRPVHCDFRTPEYTTFPDIVTKKWEATRGMSPSFGYNRFDREEDYEDPVELIRSFIDAVSKNGNLLLNVGPRGEDAGIPEPQRSRLKLLGQWLRSHGQAIYGTRPWEKPEGETVCGVPVRFTAAHDVVYAIVMGQPTSKDIVIKLPLTIAGKIDVTRLADGVTVGATIQDDRLTLACPSPCTDEVAQSFRICMSHD